MTNDNNDILEKIGKRMPYSMPDGLFDRMQDKVLKRIEEMEGEMQTRKQRKPLVRRLAIAIPAIAASVCAVCLLHFGNAGNDVSHTPPQQQTANTNAVDKAYDNLSQEEQENLLADYSNDVYMSLQ